MENQTIENEPTLIQAIIKNAIGLALFASITAGVIAIVQQSTKDTIKDNIAQAKAAALYEIVPAHLLNNDLLHDAIVLTHEDVKKQMNINLLGPIDDGATLHFARTDDKVHTFILPAVAPDGYTTAISLLVGVTINGDVTGVRIVDHKETPGLGDKVELKKSPWILSFNGTSLNSPDIDHWKVKKDGGDFDSFTGATITPRAVVDAVKRTLQFVQTYQHVLIELSAPKDKEQLKEEA